MKYKIVIIGAGRISYSLVSALLKAGYSVVSVISRNKKSAEDLAKRFNIKHYSDNLNDIPKPANVFFLSVPDGEIGKVSKKLSVQKLNFNKTFFIHFSGSEDIRQLNSLKKKGARTASLHLMQAFPSKRIVKLQNVPAAIEASSEADYKILKRFALSLKLIPFKTDSKYKSYYHLAGVFSINFLTGNLFISKEMLAINNIDETEYFNVLSAALKSVIANIKKVGPANALSGPVDRGDLKTVIKHIGAIKKLCNKPGGNYFELILKNYIVQSLNLLYLVEQKFDHLKNSHQNIKKLLVQELTKLENTG